MVTVKKAPYISSSTSDALNESEATLIAIDQGTTSTRAVLFSQLGKVITLSQKELPQHYPRKGWVEQDAAQIIKDVRSCLEEIARKAPDSYKKCAGIGITNQRETTVVWDRQTGRPVCRAIVWQDRRTSEFTDSLTKYEEMIREKTGLICHPYFSASKIRWILDNIDGAREKAATGDLLFGTVDSWIVWNLTGGAGKGLHYTCATNASRTQLFNVRDQTWDEDLLCLYDIPPAMLPQVKDNADDYGIYKDPYGQREIPISGVAGDQHAAMIGQACFEEGMVKSTYGTGCFALMNMGPEFVASGNRLLTTPAYRLAGKVTYALEGSIFIAGAAIQWLRDNLGIIQSASDTEEMARSVSDNNGVYFVPALAGLAAPYWRPDAHGAIFGLTRETKAAHLARAALEAQAYQSHDLFFAMKADTKRSPEVVRADGGLVANDFMCQFLADILNIPVELPQILETTALGAAYLAGLQTGLYADLEEIAAQWRRTKRYEPAMSDPQRQTLLHGWTDAVGKLLA